MVFVLKALMYLYVRCLTCLGGSPSHELMTECINNVQLRGLLPEQHCLALICLTQ